MGSCVSRSPPLPAVATSKVVHVDGSVAQYATPVTAREALGDAANNASTFLCSSNELRFDTPARALAPEEALRPGWLYFMLPVSMLRRPLSGQEMAALAVKVTSSTLASVKASNRKGRQKAARVAPLVVADAGERDGEWNHHVYGKYGPRKTASRPVSRAGVQRLSAISEASES